MAVSQTPSFSSLFNSRFTFGNDGKLTGQFGLNVLDDLIAGIDEFKAGASAGRPSPRDAGPALLGAFMWLDDPALLERIVDYPHACVAFTKQPRPFPPAKLARLQNTLERCPGFPSAALPELDELAVRDAFSQPQVVGPSTRLPRPPIPALRTLGYRKTGGRMVPILHAKMVLLGNLRWHEDEEFGLGDMLRFHPRKLWIGSANGTYSSRFSLEFGCWQADPKLLSCAQRFLTQVIAKSEDLDPDSNTMDPDLVEIEYDDQAMAEAWAATAESLDEDDL